MSDIKIGLSSAQMKNIIMNQAEGIQSLQAKLTECEKARDCCLEHADADDKEIEFLHGELTAERELSGALREALVDIIKHQEISGSAFSQLSTTVIIAKKALAQYTE